MHIITLFVKEANMNVLLLKQIYLILQRTNNAVVCQIYLTTVKSGYWATEIFANIYCQSGVDSHV